jgi:hypothetical protein
MLVSRTRLAGNTKIRIGNTVVPVTTSVTKTAFRVETLGGPGVIDVYFDVRWEEKGFILSGFHSVRASSVDEAVSAAQNALKELCPLLLDELTRNQLSPS